MNRVKIIVSGPANSGKGALLRLIAGILKAAKVEFEFKNPQEINTVGDLSSGQPYEILNDKHPFVQLIEDRSQAYGNLDDVAEVQAFKECFPSALYVPAKRSFYERDHNIAYASWILGRTQLRSELKGASRG